ncbi:hypothetical protein, partial [Actinocorallia lasiicapitis]
AAPAVRPPVVRRAVPKPAPTSAKPVAAPARTPDDRGGYERRRILKTKFQPLKTRRNPLASVVVVTVIASTVSCFTGALFGARR